MTGDTVLLFFNLIELHYFYANFSLPSSIKDGPYNSSIITRGYALFKVSEEILHGAHPKWSTDDQNHPKICCQSLTPQRHEKKTEKNQSYAKVL